MRESDRDKTTPQTPVDRLLSSLKDPGWKESLANITSSATFKDLANFIENERQQGKTIYPPEEDIFSALNLCPLSQVRVVIVGQDPYHGRGQGHGLAFSVRKGIRPPPSLQNIFKEAINDVGIEPPSHGYLKCWAEQGVLLLNTVLTVREGEANSHANRGWEEFTDAIIETLNTQKEGLVFLLWGNPAAKKASGVDGSRHAIIKTSHPSPLGATKTKAPFLGSKCFSRANEALLQSGKESIDWSVV
jgi:uracil-DNA glycosylase